MRFHPGCILIVLAVAGTLSSTQAAAAPSEAIRSTVSRFVNAQNAHDLKGVGSLLADAPDFLWISGGQVVRERAAAIERFKELFKGKWRIDPEWSTFQVLGLDVSTMEVFVNVSTSDGTATRKARMNLLLINTTQGWRVLNILVGDLAP